MRQGTWSEIPGRKAVLDILAEQTARALNFGTRLGLLVVDIDRFHKINRNFGYDVGDAVLRKFEQLLCIAARKQDHVGKIGDNRYTMILIDILNPGHAELAAHKIFRLLQIPFSIGDRKVSMDCTIAISICPVHARTPFALLSGCDTVQGFYLARPMPHQEACAWIAGFSWPAEL